MRCATTTPRLFPFIQMPFANSRSTLIEARLWIELDEEPTKDDVESEMDGKPTERSFFESDDGEMYFDVERLAEGGVPPLRIPLARATASGARPPVLAPHASSLPLPACAVLFPLDPSQSQPWPNSTSLRQNLSRAPIKR
jgi:hypothetical protein